MVIIHLLGNKNDYLLFTNYSHDDIPRYTNLRLK